MPFFSLDRFFTSFSDTRGWAQIDREWVWKNVFGLSEMLLDGDAATHEWIAM